MSAISRWMRSAISPRRAKSSPESSIDSGSPTGGPSTGRSTLIVAPGIPRDPPPRLFQGGERALAAVFHVEEVERHPAAGRVAALRPAAGELVAGGAGAGRRRAHADVGQVAQAALELAHDGIRLLQAGSRRGFDRGPDLARIGLREELRAVVEPGVDRDDRDEQRQRSAEDETAVAECPLQGFTVAHQNAAAQPGVADEVGPVVDDQGALGVALHVGSGQRRVGREGDDQRGGEGDADGDRQDRHEVADDAGPEEQRHESADRRQGRVEDRPADLPGADLGGLEGRFALLHVAVDVVDHDDRVVDQHADRQHQREQHHHVERHAGELHDDERQQHRERDRRADEEGVAQPHGEEEHDHDEHDAGEDVVLEIGHHDADVLRLVGEEGRFHSRRPGCLEALDLRLQPVGELDDVRTRALLHRQRHRFPAVDARVGAALLEAVAHRGDVAHLHRALADHLDHELLDGERIFDLAGDAQRERLALERELAAGDRDVLVADRVEHVVERGAVEAQPLGVDVDLHFALHAADEGRPQHAGDRLDLVLHGLGQAPELDRADVAGEVDLQDRHIGEIELAQDRFLGVGRELGLGEIDPVAHLLQREVEVDAGDELDVDHRDALGRRRGDLFDPLEPLQLAFELVGELALDVGGRGSRPQGVDEDVGNLDVGETLARQAHICRRAGDDDREQREEDRGAVPDRELAEPHFRPPRPAGSRPPRAGPRR